MRNIRIKNKNGFSILAVILVIVAVIVAIGIWALSGESNTSASSSSSAKVAASAILNNASAIKSSYDTLLINGSNPATVVFLPNVASTAAAPNVLDTVNGINLPKESANVFKGDYTEPNGVWTMNKSFYAILGSPGQPETAIFLAGIKDSVCKEINNTLYGSDFIPTYPPFNNSEQFVVGSTASNPNTTTQIDFSTGGTETNNLAWNNGCIKGATVNDNNVYFRVLKIN